MICPVCRIQFSSTEAFYLHFAEQHNDIKKESNSYINCERSESSKWKKKTAKDNPSLSCSNVFRCQKCNFATKTEQLLSKHVQTQHDPHRKVYSCPSCDYLCLQERTFRLHQRKHSKPEAKFACDQCGKLFLSMGIMKRHTLTHSKSKPFVCDREGCGKCFNIKSRLTDHLRSVHKNGTVVYGGSGSKRSSTGKKLLQLQFNFSREEELTSSKRSDDEDNGKDRSLSNEDQERAAKNISENVNLGAKENCVFSQQTQIYPSNSKDNELKAESDPDTIVVVYDIILSDSKTSKDQKKREKNWSCFESKAGVNCQSGVLKKTMRQYSKQSYSNSNSNFSCTLSGCGKMFRDSYNLRMHMCTHTGEMQRACKLCGYTCVQKSALDRHLKVHQRVK